MFGRCCSLARCRGSPAVNDIVIREATEGDAADIRSLVTRALLSAGLPSPEPELDHD